MALMDYLRSLAKQRGFVLVDSNELAKVLDRVAQLELDLEITETARGVAADGYRTALLNVGLLQEELRTLKEGSDLAF